MASAMGWLLLAVCMQASAVPLSTQLSEEEEKVTRCIMEVMAESLTMPSAERVSSRCLRILKEDERIVSMLRRQHLLRELEGLTHEGEPQPEGMESSEEEELRKRASAAKRDGATKRGTESEDSREHQKTREFQKIETVEVKEKERGDSAEETDSERLAEDEEDKRSPPAKREEKKSSEKEERSAGGPKRNSKRQFSDEDGSEEEDGGERGFHGNSHGWHHSDHQEWEDKRGSRRRTAEGPGKDETAENRGLKFFNARTHLNREAKRHYGPGDGETDAERHHYNGRLGAHGQREEEEEEEEREMEEMEEHKEEEQDLQALEKELRRAEERLQELHRG